MVPLSMTSSGIEVHFSCLNLSKPYTSENIAVISYDV